MGQFFDNIWIYIKSITSVNVSNNNLNLGISKDVVYNLLQSLGISVFNSFGNLGYNFNIFIIAYYIII